MAELIEAEAEIVESRRGANDEREEQKPRRCWRRPPFVYASVGEDFEAEQRHHVMHRGEEGGVAKL